MAMRGKAEMFVGKNTMVRFVIKKFAEEHKNQALVALADELEGNVAIIFTNEDLRDVFPPAMSTDVVLLLMRFARFGPSFSPTARKLLLASAALHSAPLLCLLAPPASSPLRPRFSRRFRSPPRSTRVCFLCKRV